MKYVTANVDEGSIAFHNGKTWHGSGDNLSKNRPRRGIGIHFVPSNIKYSENMHNKLTIKNKLGGKSPSNDSHPVTYDSE